MGASHHIFVSIGANLEEVTPLPNEFYPPEERAFKPGLASDEKHQPINVLA